LINTFEDLFIINWAQIFWKVIKNIHLLIQILYHSNLAYFWLMHSIITFTDWTFTSTELKKKLLLLNSTFHNFYWINIPRSSFQNFKISTYSKTLTYERAEGDSWGSHRLYIAFKSLFLRIFSAFKSLFLRLFTATSHFR